MSKVIALVVHWNQGGVLKVVLVRVGEELTPGSQSSEQTRNQNPTSLGCQNAHAYCRVPQGELPAALLIKKSLNSALVIVATYSSIEVVL